MDLRSELLHKRSAATGRLMEKRDYDEAAEKLINDTIICALREQNKFYPSLTYYCITFYVVEHGDGYYVAYNTNKSIGYELGDSTIDTIKEVLEVASVIARYKLETTVFREKGMTAYRFAISFN